ncbi:phosphoribosyltransferase family protein [Intrasporangium sp.]|uniref:ComF family protein n=1 Tax=Intrasporangium sp. TaxID=1925024 RepID=UPI00322179BA
MSLRQLLDLVLPAECAGCRRAGSPWCRRCCRALDRLAFPGGPRLVTPDPAPPGAVPVHAWGAYGDPLRAVVTAWKDEGRRDLVGVLAPLLTAALATVPTPGRDRDDPVLVVPAPSSRRSRRVRGDVPLHELTARALQALAPGPEVFAPVLGECRDVLDQSRLGSAARRANVSGAFTVRRAWRPLVTGRDCVVVDDLMTTGATIADCARALRGAGAAGVRGVTIAAPRRRAGR